MLKLRDYQENAIIHLRQALSTGKRQILCGACGFGKTEVAAQIIKNALAKYKRVMFVVDRIVLAEQTSSRFDKYGIDHGIMQGQNERNAPHEPCQIASAQTIIRRKIPENLDVIIVDECHVQNEAIKTLSEFNPDAYFVGLTATPFAKGMAKFWDGVVVAATTAQLTDKKYLVPTIVYAAPMPDLSKVKTVAGEFQKKSLAEETDKPTLTADIVSTWMKRGENRQTICFAVNRAHSKHIAREFNRHGISAESIDCFTKEDERKDMLARFNRGELRILTSVMVLTVGFDSPVASCAILACATKSKIKHFQSIGRVLRLYDKKENAIILDHGGNHERLGFATDDHDYTLDDGKRKKQTTTRETFESLPKACPSCTFIKPAGVRKCAACGLIPKFIKDVEFEAGELVKIQKKDRKNISTEEKQAFLAGLNMHANEKGYKRGRGCWGWSLRQYESKFGCSPSSKMNWGACGEKNEMVRGWLTHIAIAHAANVSKIKKA